MELDHSSGRQSPPGARGVLERRFRGVVPRSQPMANGIRIRGLDGDVDRVSVQSTEQDSHLLTRRRWKFLPVKWTDVSIGRDELIVLKCNDGTAVIEVKHLG